MRVLFARDWSENIRLDTNDTALYEYNGGHDDEWHVLDEYSVCDVEDE